MKTLYQSRFFTSFQSDRGRCFYVDFGQKKVKMSFCQLLSLRQKVLNINMESHFNNPHHHGFEIVMLCNKEHLFAFSTLEIIDLRELIKNTLTTLEINSILVSSV